MVGYCYLTAKKACVWLLVSNQGTDCFKSPLKDLVIRINTLPEGISSCTWFRTRVLPVTRPLFYHWATAPPQLRSPFSLSFPSYQRNAIGRRIRSLHSKYIHAKYTCWIVMVLGKKRRGPLESRWRIFPPLVLFSSFSRAYHGSELPLDRDNVWCFSQLSLETELFVSSYRQSYRMEIVFFCRVIHYSIFDAAQTAIQSVS